MTVAADDSAFPPGGIVRPGEWHRVRQFVAGARAVPAALAVTGEAGAGKSTLWRAGVAAAVQAGHRVLRTEPSEAETELSFAGLYDLLADVLPDVAAGIPAPQREALEVALLLRAPGDEPPAARAIGLGVLSVLRGCVAGGPVVVAVDDAHWLDEATTDALGFALRRVTAGPLLVLLTARSAAPADPLTFGAPPPPAGWRDLLAVLPGAEQIDLVPLNAEQMRSLLPADITAAQLRAVAERSRGNPFWAKELSASLEPVQAAVPSAARALTGRLSRSLTADAAQALAVVAAAGRIELTAALAALDHLDDPVAAVDAAVLAGVVTEAGDRLTAAHPLIGAAALEVLPPGARRDLYRRLAATSPNPERHAHFAALAAPAGPDTGVADALDAAAAAAHSRAASGAAAQFAVQAVQFTPPSDPAALVRRRIRAGELLDLAGDLRRALEQLEAIDTGQLATEDLERVLPLLLDLTEVERGTAEANAIITRAADAAGPDLRRRALALALASDPGYGVRGGRQAAAAEAIRCADAAGAAAAPALHRALLNMAKAKVMAAQGLDFELLDRAARLEPSLPGVRARESAIMNMGILSRLVEDLDGARAALQQSINLAKEAGDDYTQAMFLSYLALTEVLAGDYVAAAVAVDAVNTAVAWHGWPTPPWQTEPRCELLIAAGDLDAAASLADRDLPDSGSVRLRVRCIGACVRGRVSMWRGDPAAMVRYFEHAGWCADQCDLVDPGVRYRLDPALAEAYVATGQLDDAARISARLREVGSRLRRPALTGDACRIDALGAARAGDLDAAAQAAEAAVAAHGSSPLRLEQARGLLTLGQIERRRKARTRSRTALQRAWELASQIGHRPLQAQIQAELPRVAAARSADELTATEQRVASLIAAGATNREAAAALFVGVRTIETHVASIYRKLGVRTRGELARRLPG